MPARPSSRALLLLLLVPIVLVGIVALWLRDGDDDSMSEAGRLAAEEQAGMAAELPAALAGRDAEPLAEGRLDSGEGLAGAAGAAGTAGDEREHLGAVRGRLVDAAGQPVGGEPVFLVRDRDPWRRHLPMRDDPSPTERLLDSSRADDTGRFALDGDAGASYQLYAGGGKWARIDVGSVVAGDDLTVVMREGLVLTGTLRDAVTGAPLAEGWVLALADDCSQLARTGEDGSFTIGPVPDLVSVVGGYATGYDISMQNDVLPGEGAVQVELEPGLAVSGRVVDSETKEPLAGGEVRLLMEITAQMTGDAAHLPDRMAVDPQVAAVDAEGRFRFAMAPSRGFVLEVSSPGYVPDRIDTWREQKVSAESELVLELDKVEPIPGRAVVADGGAAAVGAAIAASGVNGQFDSAQSGDDGEFEIDPSKWDGERPVHVTARDGEGRTARKRIGAREEELVLELVPPLTIPVQVVQAGSPIVGAQVAALSDNMLPTLARSGADGLVTLVHELAGPGTSQVTVQARWGNAQSVPVDLEVAAGSPAETLVLDVDSGDRLEGTVVDARGLPVASALITAMPRPKDASSQRPAAHSDAEGQFRLAGLVPELLWDLRIEAEGYHQQRLTEVSPAAGPLFVTLQSVVRWEGRVTDGSSGQPISRFQGSLLREISENGKLVWRNTRESVRTTPGHPGEFSVPLPEAGKYELRLTSDDCLPVESAPIVFTAGGVAPPRAELLMWPAAVLAVSVQDGRGRPVRGYEVLAVPWDGSGEPPKPEARKASSRQFTNDDGIARFNLGPGGTYLVGSGATTWLDTQRLKVEPGFPVSRQYSLPATGDLEISVFDEAGQPLAGEQVEVRSAKNEKGHAVMRRAGNRSSGDSGVTIEGLPVGDYSIRLRRRNYTAEPSDVHVRGNVTERVRLEMQPRGQPVKAGPP